MKDKLLDIIFWGSTRLNDVTIRRHVIFSNIIFLSIALVDLGNMTIDIKNMALYDSNGIFQFDRVAQVFIILLCLVCLTLNKYGNSIIARCVFVVVWPLLGYILPVIIQHSPPDYYFAFPVALIFHGVVIQMSFPARKESELFVFFMVSNLILLCCSNWFLLANDPIANVGIIKNDRYYIIDQFVYWLFFNLVTYYLIFVIEDSIRNLEKAQETIAIQKDQLEETNTELEQTNIALSLANSSLETRVQLRTEELSTKNQQLVQYAYFNAHQLRGPYARVRGLFNIISHGRSLHEDPEITKRLVQSLDELESVIRYIQRTVE